MNKIVRSVNILNSIFDSVLEVAAPVKLVFDV